MKRILYALLTTLFAACFTAQMGVLAAPHVAGNVDLVEEQVVSVSCEAEDKASVTSEKANGKCGTNLTLSSTKPTRTGYTFKDWATSANGSVAYASEESYTNNANVTLYAVCEENKYTVTYNANGGSGAPASQTKTYDVALTLSTTVPTRAGYTFAGWSTSNDGTVDYAPGETYYEDGTVTLYAVWEANGASQRIVSLSNVGIDNNGYYRNYYELFNPYTGSKEFDVVGNDYQITSDALKTLETGTIVELKGGMVDEKGYIADVDDENYLGYINTGDFSKGLVWITEYDTEDHYITVVPMSATENVGNSTGFENILGYYRFDVNYPDINFDNKPYVTNIPDKSLGYAITTDTVVSLLKYSEPGKNTTKWGTILLGDVWDIADNDKTWRSYYKKFVNDEGYFTTKYAPYMMAYVMYEENGSDMPVATNIIVVCNELSENQLGIFADEGASRYLLEYNANGGSNVPGSVYTVDYHAVISNQIPVRTGYDFVGWSTKKDGVPVYYPGDHYVANEYKTLYAVWEANKYTVTYNANGGSGAPASHTKTYNVALTLSTTVPTRTGYTFKGWSTSANGSVEYASGASYTNNANVTLYAVWEQTTISSSTCDDNLTWTLDENGLFTVSGNGDMTNYDSYKDVPWYSIRSSIKSIKIGDGVTSVGNWAFYDCPSVTEIVLPDSLKHIGQWAFYKCDCVTKIEIPENVESIDDYAFWYCHNLVLVKNNSSLVFTLDSSDNGHVCDNAYKLINKDGSVTYRNGHTEDENGFVFSSYREMKAYVGDKETVTLPLSYNGKSYMVNYVRGVNKVVIPDGMTKIDNSAFNGCATLSEIVIPASVTEIGYSSLGNCRNLTGITVDENNGYYSSDSNGVLFNKDKTVVIQYPSGNPAESYAIPDSVVSVGAVAFSNSLLLKEIVIPGSVTSIENSAFEYCTSLLKVKIPDSVTNMERSAFHNCTSLEEVEITKNITTIKEHTFSDCTSLSKVKIPDGVKVIEDYAFNVCSALCEIEVPDSVEYIGFSAFDHTAYNDDESNWENGFLYIGNHLIAADRDITGSVALKDGTLCIAGEAFDGCSYLTEIKLPHSVVSIGPWTFGDCSSLENVVFGSGLKIIGDYAFDYCTSLTQIKIPDSVTTLGGSFRGCEKLENVILGKELTAIEEGTFTDCTALKTVTICNKVTRIGIGAFDRCTSLDTVYFRGTEEQWNEIDIGIHQNECLNNALIIFLGEQTVSIGDTNGDNSIDIRDVILLAQYCADWQDAIDSVNPASADTNGDGSVDIRDVILLAQYCAGWDVNLG